MNEGIDPQLFMQQVARRPDDLNDPDEIERVLDDVEYMVEALDPELQPPAYDLVERLRRKLEGRG